MIKYLGKAKGLTSAAYAVKVRIHGLHAFELHFQIVNLIPYFHIGKHVTGELGLEGGDGFLDGLFLLFGHKSRVWCS